MPRVALKPSDLLIGRPVVWDIFDPKGNLILSKGGIVADEEEKAALFRRQPQRELVERPADLLVVEAIEAQMAKAQEEGHKEIRLPLDELRLRPGDLLQMQGSTENDRYAVQLIGYQKGRSLVVSSPLKDGAPVYLREGETFVLRCFSGKLASAFAASVIAGPAKPYPYLHLSYPPEVKSLQVRNSERVALRAIAALELSNGETASGFLHDMSLGGSQLSSRSPLLASGQNVQLKFKLPLVGVDYLLVLNAAIRSQRPADPDRNEQGQTFGLQFLDLSPEDRLILAAFVYQQLAESRLS